MNIRVGEILKVKNELGIMSIQIEEDIIQTKEKNIMNGNGNLGTFNNLRVEFYKEGYLTLYSNELKDTIYLIIPPFDFNELEVYKCKIIETEQKEFDLNRIEIN